MTSRKFTVVISRKNKMQNVNLLRMCLLVQIRGDINTVMRRWLASSVNTAASYWITPYTGVTSFASKKVYLRPVKRRSWRCTHFVTKRRSTLFFLQQLGTWFATRQAWIVGGKPKTSLFNSSCNNAAEQVGSFCRSFYSTFRPPTEWFTEV